MTNEVKLELKLHPVLHDYLDALVDTGLYGNSTEQAARMIIGEAVRQAIRDKEIPPRWIPVRYQR
jgi:hypothetical protein